MDGGMGHNEETYTAVIPAQCVPCQEIFVLVLPGTLTVPAGSANVVNTLCVRIMMTRWGFERPPRPTARSVPKFRPPNGRPDLVSRCLKERGEE